MVLLNCIASVFFFVWLGQVSYKVSRRLKIDCVVVRSKCKLVSEGDGKPVLPGPGDNAERTYRYHPPAESKGITF